MKKTETKEQTPKRVWNEYDKGLKFNNQIDLTNTVEKNEDFFIGNQWKNVESNGLPAPVYNFLKRVVLFTVASITTDNIKIQASPLSATTNKKEMQRLSDIVNREFERLFEVNKISSLLREYMRNAAVDGDGCLYTYWDKDAETGQVIESIGKNGLPVETPIMGAIVTEIIENTRVFFGNPNDRRVQKQPYIIIARREMVDEVQYRAEQNGVEDTDIIKPDTDDNGDKNDLLTDDKVTVLMKMWRDRETKTIHAVETTKDCIIRKEWDMGLKLYPITWLNWDYIQDCYHGQAMLTGLIPNQQFVNKMWAMSMLSFMSSAFPKILYDGTRIDRWTNQINAAIKIKGGDVNGAAKILEPAQISPQISQYIQLAVEQTQTFLGATSVAMGDTRPDNTSAIIALQRAAGTPHEITKQNLFQSVEDWGLIQSDFMGEYYKLRYIDEPASTTPAIPQEIVDFAKPSLPPDTTIPVLFDFSVLKQTPMSLKLDVGASAYWSEIASMQTLDNLLMQNKIDLVDYLERVPEGYISKKQELIDKLKQSQMLAPAMGQAPGAAINGGGVPASQVIATQTAPEIPTGGGYSALQRKVNETGTVK